MRNLNIAVVFILIVPVFSSLAEPVAAHDPTVTLCPDGRTVNGPVALCGGQPPGQPPGQPGTPARTSKFYEYLSACMAGRAGFDPFASVGAGVDTAQPRASSAGGSASANQAVFQAQCVGCHSSGGKPSLDGISGPKAVEAIRRIGLSSADPSHMPKNGTLSESDKAAILSFLNSRI